MTKIIDEVEAYSVDMNLFKRSYTNFLISSTQEEKIEYIKEMKSVVNGKYGLYSKYSQKM